MEGDIGGGQPGVEPSGDQRVTLSASSERPRDRLGRPLEPGDPRVYPTVPERDHIDDVDAWNEGMAFIRDGLPFHAHEVFEQRWKCCPPEHREAWRALAQWGAALTQHARGNEIGRRRLADRARERFAMAVQDDSVPSVVDVQYVLDSLAQLA